MGDGEILHKMLMRCSLFAGFRQKTCIISEDSYDHTHLAFLYLFRFLSLLLFMEEIVNFNFEG